MPQPHFEKDRFYVIKKEHAQRLLSEPALKELTEAIRLVGHTYFAVNLDEAEGRSSMEAYFSKRYTQQPDHCPQCGSILAHQGGCVECPNPSCGWAACS
jgi:hypothetical protein